MPIIKEPSYTANAYADSNALAIFSSPSSRVHTKSQQSTTNEMPSSTELRKPKPHERTRAMRRRLLRQAIAANALPGDESTERVPLSKKQRRKLQHIIDSKQAKLQVRNYSTLI